eukprot:TRINITY_DN358_c0_g1_i7.p1 TRINITY_DN358_c0_g1~~TRINITY_DN358_c0_g1_i7.p1  ORF type:complete len:244 (+),score=18.59 TRINITY_DN358_c0_g1_i7:607-1338(+)
MICAPVGAMPCGAGLPCCVALPLRPGVNGSFGCYNVCVILIRMFLFRMFIMLSNLFLFVHSAMFCRATNDPSAGGPQPLPLYPWAVVLSVRQAAMPGQILRSYPSTSDCHPIHTTEIFTFLHKKMTKCASCHFGVTGVEPHHCCHACKANAGHHGPLCKKQEVKCPSCHFALTGVVPNHCCAACAGSPDNHGPRCQKIAVQCNGCSFQVTGVTKNFCCGMCAMVHGTHGPLCKKQPKVARVTA